MKAKGSYYQYCPFTLLNRRKKMKQIALIDHCTPDYFSGYSKTTVNVPVYSTMTNAEVAEAIEQEMNMIYEMLEHDHTPEELKLWDDYVQQLKDKGNDVFVTAEEAPEDDDFWEPAYLYFALINPVYQHGIMFLNP